MVRDTGSSSSESRTDRVPPHSEEAERGVLGSILLDSLRVMDLCIERQLLPESFYVPAHTLIFEAMIEMVSKGQAIDVLTVGEHLKSAGLIEKAGGILNLDRLVDSTPTAAHAEHYIDIVRQKHILRSIISGARKAENDCYTSDESADAILGRVEQAFMDITERQHGNIVAWPDAVKETVQHIERILTTRRGLVGISSGFANMDERLHGLRNGEMIILAARPSMGKTSLAMNIAENVALGRRDPDKKPHSVGVFSLEMSYEQLAMRMLCSLAEISAFDLTRGYLPSTTTHSKIVNAASILAKAPIYVDDSGGLDVMELRARARRMKKKYDISLIIVDYLQILQSREYARQGRQQETAHISASLKAMAKELKVPVFVLSQLSRAPEQRDKTAKPKLSDLRDSGAIEQDADVVCMLRRPCLYPDDERHDDEKLAVLDVVKHRNGPTGEIEMNFDKEFTRFRDRLRGVDGIAVGAPPAESEGDMG